MKGKVHEDFVVLKGIEYDTLDAGHIICIMPEGVKMRLLEVKGLPVSVLIDFVHRHGGILGPAHPCGEKYLSFTNTKRWQKSPELIEKFDFIETFNACEPPQSNEGAKYLAEKYGKPGTGGSDAHKLDCVGMGYTEFPVRIETELDLIRSNPNVCIEVESDVELISGGDVACKYGASFASVIGHGRAELTEDVQEKIRGLSLFMKNQTGREFNINEEMASTVEVIKVVISEFTAKSRSKA